MNNANQELKMIIRNKISAKECPVRDTMLVEKRMPQSCGLSRQGQNTCTVPSTRMYEVRGIPKECFIPNGMTRMWRGISVFYQYFIPNGISLPDYKTSIFQPLIRINN